MVVPSKKYLKNERLGRGWQKSDRIQKEKYSKNKKLHD